MSLANSHTHEHVFLGSSHDENARRTLWVVLLTVATASSLLLQLRAGL